MDKVPEPFGQVSWPANGIAGGGRAGIEGTGLGLPLTKTLVERHCGKLNLKSQLGQDTTITLWFPTMLLVA